MGIEETMEKSEILSLKTKGKYVINPSDLLVDGEPFFILSPKLIELLEHIDYKRRNNSMVAEALILQQMHIETERLGVVVNTYKYIEGNLYDWVKSRFSSLKSILFKNAVEKLLKENFIKIIKTDDNKEFFRINYRRFFYSKKIEMARQKKKEHIKKLREYKAKAKAKPSKRIRNKIKEIEKKLKKKKTKAVFFKIS